MSGPPSIHAELQRTRSEITLITVIISLDRSFLDRIATHMLAFEGDAHVERFAGSFADYEEDQKRRLGVEEVRNTTYSVAIKNT